MTDLIAKRRDEAMEQLRMIADGTINPGGSAVVQANSSQVCANARLLTRSQLSEVI